MTAGVSDATEAFEEETRDATNPLEPDGEAPRLENADGVIEPWADRIALQRALEARTRAVSRSRGEARLARGEARGAASETGYGVRAVADALEPLAAAIRTDRDDATGKRGVKPEALRLVEGLEPETIAYLTLRALVDQLARQPKLSTAAIRVGALLEQECLLREQERVSTASDASSTEDAGAPSAKKRRPGRPAGRRAPRAPSLATLRAARQRGWTARQTQICGLRLLHLALETVDIAEIVEAKVGGEGAKRVRRLAPSARLVETREKARRAAAAIAPQFEPMAAPPKPWRGPRGGGYLTRAPRDLTLVKTQETDVLRALTPETAPIVFRAVNVAQATAWRVNARILSTMEACEAAQELCASAPIPAQRAAPRPDRDAPGRQRWAWWEQERRRRSRRLAWDRMIAQAQRYRRLPAIYFPYQYDFRGRLYAVPEFSPQGPDPMRGLLQFGRAEPLGAEGWKWLAIHLCNSGDFCRMSKAPLSARAEWTLANEERILTVAADPLADFWWADADRPWQFLAACFEWEGFRQKGESFRSALPIALDGSCSGIQHFSLALRDEIGGAAVNLGALSENDAASDIYAEVARAVVALLRDDLTRNDAFAVGRDGEGRPRSRPVSDLARAWLAFGVNRALCKRPTMTYGYGARGYGYVDQILQDTLAPAFAAHKADPSRPWPFEGRGFGEALYLAARMTEAIERTVLKAAEAMRWLQEVADCAAAEGVPLSWTAVDGFKVRQAYRERVERRVKTLVTGRPVRLTLREETDKLDARRQRQGVAPNFVHSLDACHLRLTVARAAEEGITDLALVHDSFAAHAAHTPRFFQLIREAMVEMYDATDVVGAFRDEIAGSLSEKGGAAIAPPPSPGSLDLVAVLQSDHCFS